MSYNQDMLPILAAFGISPNAHLPKEGAGSVYVNGVEYWIDPSIAGRFRLRIFCRCPKCGKVLTAGRLRQHSRMMHKGMTRQEALAFMHETHAMWTVAHGHAIITALGLDPKHFPVETWRANTGDPKGLHTQSGKRNEKVSGYSSFGLVEDIARHLKLEYRSDFLGRGSQQHECARAIIEHFKQQG